MNTGSWSETLKKRDQLKNLNIDGRMILKWIKERQNVWTDPGSRTLWKFGQILVPSSYYEISTSRKKGI